MSLRKLFLLIGVTLSLIPTTLSQINLSKGLVAYYPLNGNANDYSGNGLHGLMKNGIKPTTDRYNQMNSAMIFDGIDDYIEVPDNSLLRFRDSFSITFLFNRTAQSTISELIEKRDWTDGSKSSFDIGLISPGKVRTAIKTGSDCSDPLNGWVYPTVSDFIQPDQWYCVATTFNKGEVKFFLNGVLVGVSTATVSTMDSCTGSSLRMGIHWQGDPLPFQGKMDEVRLYNRALDVGEVAALCDLVAPVLCTGSLGAPVVNINFGTFANPTGNLPTLVPGATTTLSFVPVSGNPARPIPADGQYTISNNTPFNDAWFAGYQDHTPGDTKGNLAFFNASESPGEFYKQTVTGLCENTTYEFAAWIANVLDPGKLSGILPDLTFRIEKTDGTLIGSFNTGGIPQSARFTWKQYGFLFSTPAGISSVVLKLINNNVGGTAQPGNDLAIDDITFRPCGGKLTASFSNTQIQSTASQCSNSTINLYGASTDLGQATVYRWQVRSATASNWTDIATSNMLSIQWPIPRTSAETKFWFRILSGNSSSISSPSCRIQSDSIALTAFAIPAGTLDGTGACGETNPVLQFKSSAGFGPSFELLLQEGSSTPGTIRVLDSTDFSASVPLTTATNYKVLSIKDQNSCVNNAPGILINLTPTTLPDAQLTPLPGCIGDSAKVRFTSTEANVSMGFTFSDGTKEFTITGAVDGKQITLPVILSSQTNLQLLTLYRELPKQCVRNSGFDPATITFTVSPSPQIEFKSLQPICEGTSSFALNTGSESTGIAGLGTYYGTGVQSNSFNSLTAGIGDHRIRYEFVADNGCSAFAEQSITVVPLPVANAGQDVIACANTPMQLKGSGGTTYSWSPAMGLSDPSIANPVVQINQPTEYVLTVKNAAGCSDQDVIKVGVSSSNKSGFSMPNAFTPNGDGKNDCFGLQHWGQVSNLDFKIYNRWGQIIFTSTESSKCWNGQINGKPLNTDQFVYTVSGITGCGPVNLKGTVHLIR